VAKTHARTRMLISRLLSALCCIAVCSVVSAQEDSKAAPIAGELDHARQLIRATPCPGVPGNPVRVIQSVNCLRALGKKGAIALLFEVASVSDTGQVDSTDIDAKDWGPVRYDQTICTIIPLLFDVPDHGTPPPDAWYCAHHKKWIGVAGTRVLQGDIPFAVMGEWTYDGLPEPTRPLVEWAANHGELRARNLVPQNDPLEAAEALHGRIKAGAVAEFEQWTEQFDKSARDGIVEGLQSDLRAQAIGMLHNGMRIPVADG
jgi:hypothetical protein